MKGKKLLNISLIVMVAMSMIAILGPTVSAVTYADAISILPSQKIYESEEFCTYNNTEFTVQVYIDNITDCAGYQFWLYYNDTLLEMTSWTFDTDPANPLSPTQMAPAPGDRVDTEVSVPGIVKLATVWKFGVDTYNGSGVAAELTFKIIYCPPQIVATPQKNNTVSCDLAFDEAWTRACDYWGDDILFIEFNDGYYEYTTIGKVPPKPISIYTDKYSYSVGDTMYLGLNITNPLNKPITVCIAIWLEKPFVLILHAHAVTLPASFTYSNPNFESFVLPSIPLRVYTWHAAFLKPTNHKILVEDTAEWEFV